MASSGRHEVPLLVRMAAHPLRWALLTELAGGDRRVRELVAAVGEPQNLVSYHLRLLRSSGLVGSRRSSFDGRDSYYRLDLERCAGELAALGPALHPALATRPIPPAEPAWPSVLFLCTGNSARSPIAEALLRHRSGGRAPVASAGSRPKDELHPRAVGVLRRTYGIDVGRRRPRHLDEVAGHRFHYVVSLCDKVREVVPAFDGQPRLVHWSVPDPARTGGFDEVAAEIDARVGQLVPVLLASPSEVRT
ncbi:ArsR family transcriptional regulator [Nonomuraea soli]|uniref:Protein-tyrosine-phosphatase/DNA-binding transcriptional ArsR family regulator n=1 Tax=Nonomuraea soli TaxID=1032476 RepID=A0A7W0HP01_9ACTN|nr:ArsR family transcriptional regulator [Nonomuraea soli]MBA2890334.1 protein-tyrosine-phosphatase/DNA-binding transcriptional ArsR family regulator [Nonomuraea soli]